MKLTASHLSNQPLYCKPPSSTLADMEFHTRYLTDNRAQYTSELFKEFARTYKFNHITSSPYWSQSNGRAEAAVKSAKQILRTAKDVDLALLSVRNTPPSSHTFSPAQRLFGRALRSNLPQPPVTVESSKLQCDTVVTEHLHRKLQQKQAYDKHAGQPLPDFPPGSYVYAKPPPNSPSKECISGHIIGFAGPRSYFIKTGSRQIRRNRVQVQLAPPSSTIASPHQTNTTPLLPEKLRPNPLIPRPLYVPSVVFTAAPNDASPSPMPSNTTSSTPTVPSEPSSEAP